jgi:gamma-glutamyltranspeptidase/glutathione hydrolase
MPASTPSFISRPEIAGTFGAVASTHWIATAVGMAILEKGGNAFDAGVAVAFALQVVEPHLNGPGGDVVVLVHAARRGVPEVICGQGPAPRAATIAAFRALGLGMVPGTGLLAACVPGTFDTWMLLLREYGTLPLADVLAPAIGYAARGYPLIPRISQAIAAVAQRFREHWPTSAALYLPGGTVPQAPALFRNPALAETYARILREAEAVGGNREAQIERAGAAWREGFVAEAIDAFCGSEAVVDDSGRPHHGLLTGEDMAQWRATVEPPVTFDYGGFTVCKAGPWSQGPVMLQQLALLAALGLDASGLSDADFIHLQVECAKLAYADREAFYGDPDFVNVPIAALLSPEYNQARRTLIGERASLQLQPGSVDGRTRHAGASAPAPLRATDAAYIRRDTVHFDIVDAAGNMISATPSGGWLDSSPVIPELGFALGTRAEMFWLAEDHPAALAPGKRPRTTLSPNLVLRDREPYLAFGTPGGDLQDQWCTQFFLRHVHGPRGLQAAIDAPRWHSEHVANSFWPRTARPGVLVAEANVGADTIEALRRRGHIIEVAPAWSEGKITAVCRNGELLSAAADARGAQAYAIGR